MPVRAVHAQWQLVLSSLATYGTLAMTMGAAFPCTSN